MAFDVSTLNSFTLEDSGILLQKSILGADLMNYLDVRPGYPEASVAINILDVTPDFNTASCGWSDDGSVDFTQVTVNNGTKSWKTSLCLEDLRSVWLSTQLAASAYGETLPFETVIENQMTKATKKVAETVIATELISQVTTGNGAAAGPTGAWTSSNAYDRAIAMLDVLPQNVADRDDLLMIMSYANFRYLQTSIVSKNLFHYSTGETTGAGPGQSIIIPGTNVRAVPSAGWGTSNRVIVGPSKHIIVTCGLTTDTDNMQAWWSRDNQEFRMISKFTMGAGTIVEEFVSNDLA